MSVFTRLCFPPVPCMLEHESLQDISSMKPTGFRKRSSSIYEDQEVCTIYSLLQQLSLYHSTMSQHGMEEVLVRQVGGGAGQTGRRRGWSDR